MTLRPTPRRTVLAASLAVTLAAVPSAASATHRHAGVGRRPADVTARTAEYHGWTSAAHWRSGTRRGTGPLSGRRPGLILDRPAGFVDYTDPHTGRTRTWEHATWLSPVHRPTVPAGELVASWNAATPAGTWLRVELLGTYTDGTRTPWYTLGNWASGDRDMRRTSVDGQADGKSRVRTDTFVMDGSAGPGASDSSDGKDSGGMDTGSRLRLAAYQLRVTLFRAPGSSATPVVWRLGAMTSDVPDRFVVPETGPGPGAGRELVVPRYSQNVHSGRYPEYNNGGEAWCSPASAQMVIEYWGRRPTSGDLAWVKRDYDDPQVCHAARSTYDYRYGGCGNWSFNAAYAASYPDMQGVVTRLDTLTDAERLIEAGIPLITSQSFQAAELDGTDYGTAGHLMAVVGFTAAGDVIANDPAGRDNPAVRRVYRRREFENVWLRTKRRTSAGTVASGTGGICYLFFPAQPTPVQLRALDGVGVR